jgi:hypothetical protein
LSSGDDTLKALDKKAAEILANPDEMTAARAAFKNNKALLDTTLGGKPAAQASQQPKELSLGEEMRQAHRDALPFRNRTTDLSGENGPKVAESGRKPDSGWYADRPDGRPGSALFRSTTGGMEDGVMTPDGVALDEHAASLHASVRSASPATQGKAVPPPASGRVKEVVPAAPPSTHAGTPLGQEAATPM